MLQQLLVGREAMLPSSEPCRPGSPGPVGETARSQPGVYSCRNAPEGHQPYRLPQRGPRRSTGKATVCSRRLGMSERCSNCPPLRPTAATRPDRERPGVRGRSASRARPAPPAPAARFLRAHSPAPPPAPEGSPAEPSHAAAALANTALPAAAAGPHAAHGRAPQPRQGRRPDSLAPALARQRPRGRRAGGRRGPAPRASLRSPALRPPPSARRPSSGA